MFKAILAHLLILTALLANCSQLLVYAGFEMNENYIVSTLCVNRDKPAMHCNGKCYLMRKLKQAEQKEKSRERDDQRTIFQQAMRTEKLSFSPCFTGIVRLYQPEQRFRLPQFQTDIFQPPRV